MFMGALAIIAFLGSVGFPIALAIGSWRLAQAVRAGWAVHTLLAPLLVAVEWGAIQFLGFTVGDDGEGPPGAGFLYAPGFVTLTLTVLVYYVCVAIAALSSWFRRHARARSRPF
jgi:hypothetical protein